MGKLIEIIVAGIATAVTFCRTVIWIKQGS